MRGGYQSPPAVSTASGPKRRCSTCSARTPGGPSTRCDRILRPEGLLFLAVKAGSGEAIETARYGLPRFFQYWSDAELDGPLGAHGFQVLTRTTDDAVRDTWLTRLARLA